MRPVLLVDEAQEMCTPVLNELRILSSTRFDSKSILGVVLAGDGRLPSRLSRDDLLPLGSRIRTRLTLEPTTPEDLRTCLLHRMKAAGNVKLMTKPLVDTLCEHALGNYRMLVQMAAEVLAAAARREQPQLDEKLYLEVFAAPQPPKAQKSRRARS